MKAQLSILIIILSILGMSITSCKKEGIQNTVNGLDSTSTENALSLKEEFARIFSLAIFENLELRSFIKDEALKQFDKDFDVFYPFVKDSILPSGRSFRDILLEYTTESELKKIEDSHPLINILVPDWSWIGAFSVNTWDISDNDIIVGIDDNNETHIVYYKGRVLDSIEKGVFPSFPTLIIKENERMMQNRATKGSSPEYAFVSDVYNNTITKVTATTSYVYPATNPGSNLVDKAVFAQKYPEVVSAWTAYGDDPLEAQRKGIYYGMTKDDQTGILNPKIRESVVAIRLNNTNCIDDSNDPDVQKAKKKKSDYDNFDDLLNAIWSDGQFEIKLYASYMDGDTKIEVNGNPIPVNGKDLFDISVIKLNFYHKTPFTAREYVYLPQTKDLVPKWYYLPTPLKFEKWDPEKATYMNIHAYEVDGKKDKQVDETIKTQKGITLSAKIGDKYQFSFNSDSATTEKVIHYIEHQDSDDLGSYTIHFDDYVIRKENSSNYELNVYSTANLDFILVPCK